MDRSLTCPCGASVGVRGFEDNPVAKSLGHEAVGICKTCGRVLLLGRDGELRRLADVCAERDRREGGRR